MLRDVPPIRLQLWKSFAACCAPHVAGVHMSCGSACCLSVAASELQVSERKHLPTLREFLNPVVEDMDPENCIEDEFKVRA